MIANLILLAAAALLLVAAYLLHRARHDRLAQEGIDVHARHKENFNRFSAYTALILGAAQLTAHIAGGIAIWIVEFQLAIDGRRFTPPDLPWGFMTAVVGFVLLSVVAGYFSQKRDDELGRTAMETIIDAARRLLGRAGGRVGIEVESEDEQGQ